MKTKTLIYASSLVLLLIACKQKKDIPLKNITSDYEKGESLYYQDNDSAFFYFNKEVLNPKDTLDVAMAYSYMGIIQSDAGDYFGSEESLLASLKFLNETNKDHYGILLSDYNELGSNSLHLKNYEDAIRFYDQALKYTTDKSARNIALNNKAVAYQNIGQDSKAIGIYRDILGNIPKDTKEYARTLCNYASAKWNIDSSYDAAPELWEALTIRQRLDDKRGINASLSHLSDYYIYKQPDSSLFYARKMLVSAKQLKSPDNEIEALKKLIILEDRKEEKIYFSRYLTLSDSLQTHRNNAKNQFALIKYETAKMKADKLSLEKQNSDKKIQIILLWFSLSVIAGLSIIGFILYRKRKQKALQEQRLKTSQKVHDSVANNIYRVISELEHSDTIEKDTLLEQLDIVYERSRNISHEIADPTSMDFSDTLQEMLTSFSSSKTTVLIVGNSNELWKACTPFVHIEIHNVLQELMVNMRKHSSASNVVIRFESLEKQLQIIYSDDGIGLPKNIKYGKGIRNTENRIKNIGGKITFDHSDKTGLKILITIPIDFVV